MKKISVIIPTIQSKIKVLNKLLMILKDDSAVDEIVLINNSQEKFVPVKKIKKLKIFNQKKNLFVNPSWNLGIELIKNDYFLIINDDILCPYNFCSIVMSSDIFDKDDTGLVGLCQSYINNFDRTTFDDIDIPVFDESKPIEFESFDYYMGTGEWASAFFGNKKNYYQIPDEIKIIYGDNYLLKRNLDAGKKNYSMKNLVCNHIASSSSLRDDLGCDINDSEFAEEYFREDNV